MVRILKVGRLYKLVKLTRLLRVLKLMKDQSKILNYMNEYLKVGLGYERLFFFLLISFILAHIVACLWVIVASFNSPEGNYKGTWVEE